MIKMEFKNLKKGRDDFLKGLRVGIPLKHPMMKVGFGRLGR